MFLTDKYHALLPFHASSAAVKNPRRAGKALSKPAGSGAGAGSTRFGAALSARLGSLLPLPASPLAALARLADLLALTLADAVPALAGEGDATAVAAHLDKGVALLDACNAITARLDRLRRRRLLSRFALHLLSSSPQHSSIRRARAALADRDERAPSSPPPPLPSLPFDQPRDRLSAAASVLLAVDAVSSLAAAAAAAVFSGASLHTVFPLVSASGDFPWAEAFNAVSTQLATLATKTGEVDAVDEAVRKLTSVIDTEGELDEAALRAVAQEVEKRTEDLAASLDRLSDAVNGVFRAALCLRNAELGSIMVGPAEKTFLQVQGNMGQEFGSCCTSRLCVKEAASDNTVQFAPFCKCGIQ
ncbi:hypothetical protein GUJ93_ZPchr0458g22680 [Zizania palustris]|uniref:Uncharacterized protein n=1 Tax=Zizania palustris TaxID=103762 RepID=A0A8J5UZX1_ZIZPA|nr:hypothetical protein GUJ93_ZPchr0458g22680 [Zizania palustris]